MDGKETVGSGDSAAPQVNIFFRVDDLNLNGRSELEPHRNSFSEQLQRVVLE